MAEIRIKRGTRAQLDAAAVALQLKDGEPYFITDELRLAVGSGPGVYVAAASESEIKKRLIAFAGEISSVTVGNYLSFGNGITTASARGVVMPWPGDVVALSLAAHTAGSGPLELEVVKNQVATGASVTLASSAQANHAFPNPAVAFVADDVLNAVVNSKNGYGKIVMTIFCEV